jgi:RNA polymerase sigma-70 factor (ECF subfamily)
MAHLSHSLSLPFAPSGGRTWFSGISGLKAMADDPATIEKAVVEKKKTAEAAASRDFDALVREHGPYVWRVLRRLGVQEADVEDIWQETFIVVHRKLDTFEGRSSIRTWMTAIGVRVASDYRNRAHRRRERPTEILPDAGTAAEQDENLQQQERRALLDKLLATLKEDQRQVLVLYEFAELPMSEVAEAIGCPLQTAYSRLHAARRALEGAARRETARSGDV